MEKKFRVLRIIGTFWKVLAWVTLIVGALSSLGVLLIGILGSGGFVWRYFGEDPGVVPGAMAAVGATAGFIAGLIATIIYFLILYAVGELVFLLLAIEENTRLTVGWMQYLADPATQAQQSAAASPAATSTQQAPRTSPPSDSEP